MRKRTELEELVGEHALLRAELQEADRRAKDAPALRVPSSPGEDELRPPSASKREHEESVARRVKQRTRGASASHAPVVESDEEQPSAQPVDYRELGAEDTVQCPICQQAFTTVALNEHLDRGCTPGRASPPRAASGRMDAWLGVRAPQEDLREAKRLTRPQYQLKSERDMRKLLEVRGPMCRRCSPVQSLGLSSTGNKDRLWSATGSGSICLTPTWTRRRRTASRCAHCAGSCLRGSVARMTLLRRPRCQRLRNIIASGWYVLTYVGHLLTSAEWKQTAVLAAHGNGTRIGCPVHPVHASVQ